MIKAPIPTQIPIPPGRSTEQAARRSHCLEPQLPALMDGWKIMAARVSLYSPYKTMATYTPKHPSIQYSSLLFSAFLSTLVEPFKVL